MDRRRTDGVELLEELARALRVAADREADPGVGTPSRPPVLPVSTAAEWVGMSDRGFRKLIARGEVPAAKVGKRYVVLVDLWLKQLHAQAKRYGPGGVS